MRPEVVYRKLRYLSERLDELAVFEAISLSEYLGSFQIRRAVERLFQLMVDTATDLNDHIIVELGYPPPRDYFESFVLLGNYGIISEEFARELAPAAGQRNILVHEYEAIDDTLVHANIRKMRELFKCYIEAIKDFMERKGQGYGIKA